jgi:RNA polymerase sigma-70 factor (ECF subfamily)
MAQVRDGSVAAFQALYDRHHRALFTFLLRFLADRPAAEDLLQEAFLRVYLHGETYRPTAAFRTWLFTIARNLAVDELRRRGGGLKIEGAGTVELAVDPEATPLQQAEARDLVEQLQAAVERLPLSQREVLLLSRFVGLSHEEIARVTETSVGAVRVTLHRALSRLRDLLDRL